MICDSVVTYVDVVVRCTNKLDTHDAFVAATTDNELVISRLSICAWDRLCKANVVKFPHIVYFPEPFQCFALMVGIGAQGGLSWQTDLATHHSGCNWVSLGKFGVDWV